MYPCTFKQELVESGLSKCHSSQSNLIKMGAGALIFRAPSAFGNLDYREELRRRNSAIAIASTCIPQYMQACQFLVLEGQQSLEDGSVANTPLIARRVDWLDDVTEVRAMSINEILTDEALCKAIVDISSFAYKQSVSFGRVFDLFSVDALYQEYWQGSAESVLTPNIMVGTVPGMEERKVFVDADWYFTLADSPLSGISMESYLRYKELAEQSLMATWHFFAQGMNRSQPVLSGTSEFVSE